MPVVTVLVATPKMPNRHVGVRGDPNGHSLLVHSRGLAARWLPWQSGTRWGNSKAAQPQPSGYALIRNNREINELLRTSTIDGGQILFNVD